MFVEDSEPITPQPPPWLMIRVLLFTLGSWREYNAFTVFIGSWFYRRLKSVTVDLLIHLKRDKNIRGHQ